MFQLATLKAKLIFGLGIAVVFSLYTFGVYRYGVNAEREDWQEKVRELQVLASKKQGELEAELKAIRGESDDKVAAITARLDAANELLRNRPERIVERTRLAACKGSTGAELSREDGEFLTGEAARAQLCIQDLIETRERYEAVKRKVDEFNKGAGD